MIRRHPQPIVSRKIAALFGLLLAAATIAFVVPLLPFQQTLREGDFAPRTLVATHDKQYESDVLTAAARDQAARNVATIPLPVDPAVRAGAITNVDKLFEQVRNIRAIAKLTPQQQVDQLAALPLGAKLTSPGRTVLFAVDATVLADMQTRTDAALNDILSKPVTAADIPARIDDYLSSPKNVTDAVTGPELTGIRAVLTSFAVPTFAPDTQATQQKQSEARNSVSPIVKTYTHGQVIVGEGDVISAEDIEALRATGVIHDGFDFYDMAGGALVAAALGLALAIYTYLFQPFQAPARRRMLLVGLAIVAVLAATRLASPLTMPDTSREYLQFAVPVAAAAIIAAAFADLAFACVVAVVTGLFAAFIVATLPQLAGSTFVGSMESLELAAAYITAGLAGAAAVHNEERLSRYAFAAVVCTLVNGAVLSVFWLISVQRANVDLGWMALAAAASGIGAAVVGLAVLVLLSLAFGVTTRLQLMELTQAGHPLLRRLQEEAPGTYHHSMLVGALAERAADNIGADALVARVGSYYHDVGKLASPGNFIENMLDSAESPHETLSPEASASRIRAHVTDGMEMARRYHLPPVVRDFIPQHHGTRLVTYFYRRAVQSGESVDPAQFRYAGPRPRSKEAAIVMLADSCEAVVRARQGESRPGVDELIDGIFAERLAEGQLDECDITMRELQAVATSFKVTLRAIYHPRVQYPNPTPEEIAGIARGDGLPV